MEDNRTMRGKWKPIIHYFESSNSKCGTTLALHLAVDWVCVGYAPELAKDLRLQHKIGPQSRQFRERLGCGLQIMHVGCK